jgi:acid phosphatase type 7
MRSHAVKYVVCVLFACAAAVALAVSLLVVAGPGAEPARAQVAPEATLVGAGDIASCNYNRDYDTAKVVDSTITSANAPVTVVTLGDNAYPDGNTNQYKNCYDPTWGGSHLGVRSDIALKVVNPSMWTLTQPAVGNHEYRTQGASAYFGYFGAEKAGDPGKGYYSYDRGSWHIIVLNSNCDQVGGCGASSPQGTWLTQDLATHPASCTAAAFHHPLFTSSTADTNIVKPFWTTLYNEGADVILSGHAHYYERFAPQRPDGTADSSYGIREFVVGTGGASPDNPMRTPRAMNSEVDSEKPGAPGTTYYGVLKLDLLSGGYAWEFRPRAGDAFTDSGSGQCHGAPGSADSTPPTVTQVSPLENAPDVSTNTTVTANFSETMKAATINATTFTLTNTANNSQLPATVSYNETNNTATLTPSSALANSTTYLATVSAGAQDLAGNALDQDPNTADNQAKTWTFTTEALSAPSNLSAKRSGSPSQQRIDLTWTYNSSSQAGFVIERSTTSSSTTFVPLTETGANTRSYSDSNLQNKTTYYYRVFAVDSTGTRSGPSNVASATTK